MDAPLLVVVAVAVLFAVGLFFRIARPSGRPSARRERREGREKPELATGNLDFSILGQRPEIVTEEEPRE